MLPRPFELERGYLVGEAVQDQHKVPRPAGPLRSSGTAALEYAVVLTKAAVRIGRKANVGFVRMVGNVEGAEAVAMNVLPGWCRRCHNRIYWGERASRRRARASLSQQQQLNACVFHLSISN